MKTYLNTNEKFGTEGPFEAKSKEVLADEMMPTLIDWAKEDNHSTSEEMRKDFIDGLVEQKMANRKYYAWVGQNASTGTPHPITGNMSMFGTNYVFRDKSERDEFVEDYRPLNPRARVVACSKKTLRGYNLGISVRYFEEDLLHSDVSRLEDEDGYVEWVRD